MATRKNWKIEPVVLADAPAIAETNIAAFWDDKHWRLSWDDNITKEYLIKQETDRTPDDLLYRRDILRHLKAVDPDTGKLAGYLRLALPVEHATTADGTPVWPEFQVADVSPEEKQRIQETHDKAWHEPKENGSEDTAYAKQKEILSQGIYTKLRYLTVHPDYQRQGAGKALVQFVVDKSKELGTDVYIMAYAAGRPLYEKLGFREIARTVEDMAKWGYEGEHVVCFMVYNVNPVEERASGN